MIKPLLQKEKFFVCLITFAALLACAHEITAQCGLYFKPNYRAVGKFPQTLNSYYMDDWTGDGKPDLWTFQWNEATLSQKITVYRKTADGWDWDNPINYATSLPGHANRGALILMDFNGDGRTDFYYYNGGDNRIHLNNGAGALVPLADNLPLYDQIGFADINGDGIVDRVGLTQSTGVLGYQPGSASGAFGQRVNVYTGSDLSSWTGVVYGDFTGDGKTDIAFTFGSDYGYKMLVNMGNNSFTLGTSVITNRNNRFRAVKDMNGDGRADVLVKVNSPGNKIYILYGQANGNFSEYELPNDITGADNFGVAELNGDNFPDIISYGYSASVAYINNGAGSFTGTARRKNEISSINRTYLTDADGDGKTDVVEIGGSIFGEQVLVVRQNTCQPRGDTKRIEFDGDPLFDLVSWNPQTGGWRVAHSDLNGMAYTPPETFTWGLSGDVAAIGDYDGDGRTDYGIFRPSNGYWSISLSSNSSWLTVPFGAAGDIPVPADYDGGGKTDLAVFRPSTGDWYIFSSETQQFTALHFGANGDKPVAEDYDGDGKTDIAVYRPSNGGWYILKSADNSFAAFGWGISTDKPIPADYDGDGKADLTVYRSGTWYILRSSTGGFGYFYLGDRNVVPMPIYDSAGIAQAVIYSPAGRYWTSYRNPSYRLSLGAADYVPVYLALPNN